MRTQNGRHPERDMGPQSSNALAHTGQTVDRPLGREPWAQEPPPLSAVPQPFHIFETTADGRRVIAPCGELDRSTTAQLEKRLAGNSHTVLDLSELSFIDSTGIHLVLRTAQRARSEAWDFTVRNPQPAVLRVIRLVGLAEHLDLETDTQEDEKQPSRLT